MDTRPLLQVAILSCLVGIMSSMTTACVVPLQELYGVSSFDINMINFIQFIVYLFIGSRLVLHTKIGRFHLLLGCSLLVWISALIQSMCTYYSLVISAVLSSIPLPFLLSHITLWIDSCVLQDYKTQMLTFVLMIIYGFSGFSYLFGLYYMSDIEGIHTYWYSMSIVISLLAVLSILVVLLPYYVSDDEDVHKPLTRERVTVIGEHVTITNTSKTFYVYMVMSSLLTACGLVITSIMPELFDHVKTTRNEAILISCLYGIIPFITSCVIGWLYDTYMDKSSTYIPMVSCFFQMMGTFGIFYWSDTSLSLALWLTVYAIGNIPVMIVFIATMEYKTNCDKSEINEQIMWWSSFLCSLSIFTLLIPSTSSVLYDQFIWPLIISNILCFILSFISCTPRVETEPIL